MIEAVDLFCGVGGLTAGLRGEGVRVLAGYDIDSACEFPYQENNDAEFVLKDVTEVTVDEIRCRYTPGAVRLLAGCAPCQPFSTYNQGRDTSSDRKWPLLDQFARLIEGTAPDLVTMENVPDVTKHDVYHRFVATLTDRPDPYHVWAGTVSCADYGLPQRRKRHVLLASRLGPVELISPTHADRHITVKEAIGALLPVAAGESDPIDPLHTASRLSDINMKRIRASKPDGTWRDWPKRLRAACHQKASGKTYPGVYGRMSWDKPSPTMTTLCYGYGNGRFGHPSQDRAITLREAALLQAFPPDYVFVPPDQPVHFRTVGRMIGNAVPVRLGEIIAKSLHQHLEQLSR
ncbi:DNA cytosine methyltransferase [Frateuria defendens]|uniref:DNA cytosine methyltransferase n=1 Tax=Frateuria defendens TaxID=2219559 RepID=UPI0009E1A241|nr:DNA cytosine methyltransferase [Frateuria defendens]